MKPADLAQPLRWASMPLACAVLAACASTAGIEREQQALQPAVLGATAADVVWPAEDWWTVFGDAQLDRAIVQALQGAPTLAQARARVVAAQARAAGAHADLYPQVGGALDVTRQRFSENGFYPPPLGGSADWINNVELDFSWELDFFGRNRAIAASATNLARAAQADLAAARLGLASSVARAYFELARLQAEKRVLEESRQQREASLKLASDRAGAGLDTQLPVYQAESALAQTRLSQQTNLENIQLARNALAALLAIDAGSLAQLEAPLTAAHRLQLPASVPADLVGRRPDVVAARWRVEAAAETVTAARADFYPNVNLVAFIGLNSLGFPNWFKSGSETYGVGPAIRLPIFEAGRLRARLAATTADVDQAVAGYNGTVVEAVHDVADQLVSNRSIGEQQAEQARAESAARKAYDVALQRYDAGLENFLTVLIAQDTWIVQRQRGTALQARALQLDVALLRALGGGFDDAMPDSASIDAARVRASSRDLAQAPGAAQRN